MEEETTQDQLDAVQDTLAIASKYLLTNEVIVSALNYMKEDNKISITQALSYGLSDWIK